MKRSKVLLITLLVLSWVVPSHAQPRQTQNLVIVTLDGLRWQEVFRGVDEALFKEAQGDVVLANDFRADTPQESRQKLMPFLWNTITTNGQIYGNRDAGNFVNVKNPYWISYPGYNEIFTGYPDPKVRFNSHPDNANRNVLEFLNQQSPFHNQVAAFSSWSAFDRILNEKRSGFPVNAGLELVEANLDDKPLSEKQQTLNETMKSGLSLAKALGNANPGRNDAITFQVAQEFLHVNQPRVLLISFGATDSFAHAGKYNRYLQAAHQIDDHIRALWEYLQSNDFYRGKTSLFITIDHGRGVSEQWIKHNAKTAHSDEIWFAVMGPDTLPVGEVTREGQLYQNQFAQTLASLLGVHFESPQPIGEAIPDVFRK